ncbi:hypothetical protein R3P38DRAFT_3102181 [Favolaschia claudopus]|uniref:Uncharacterized protein n=1 Tax=Favolaschia claudopus TaxID=2862362 RepID=A0AAV9ZL65_9AGAR
MRFTLTPLLRLLLAPSFISLAIGVKLPPPDAESVCCVSIPGACGRRAEISAPIPMNPVPLSSVKAPDVCCCIAGNEQDCITHC